MKKDKSLLVVAFALAAASALAQTPPPPGGPADGPGKDPLRGPGRPPHGAPDAGTRLLLNRKVRAELRLTDEQVAKIQALAPKPGELPKPPAGDARPPQPGEAPTSPKEGAKDAPKDGPEERLAAILSDEQRARFRQIRLQREGARAILRPDVAQELGLTDDQLEKLRPAPPREGEAPKPPVEGERPDPSKDEARILAALTGVQRAKWQAMLGQPFDLGEREELSAPPAAPK